MGLWENSMSHAKLINTYSYNNEVMYVIKNNMVNSHLQLVTADCKPSKRYERIVAINMKTINLNVVHFDKC